ncbi:MAG: MipA/OmpV family protein [Burkholderiaceae bacterium]|nr:MipA/OmpV family protein [Burkholderiaceae bacterium]
MRSNFPAAVHGAARRRRAASVAALVALACATAHADDEAPAEPPPTAPVSRWLLGVAAIRSPDYPGADHSSAKLRPLWAWQYGRFRISTSRAGGILGFGVESPGPGASVEMFSSERVRLGAALRFDSGRSSADSPALTGLPDVKRTLRARLYGSYAIDKQWGLGAALSQDVLGRRGGSIGTLDLGWRARLGEKSEWTAGLGLAFGSGPYMRTYFGVTDASALQTGIAAYTPRAGLRDIHAGIGITSALTPHWIGFAGLSAASLRGQAADSPLTRAAFSTSASTGIAYRWGP